MAKKSYSVRDLAINAISRRDGRRIYKEDLQFFHDDNLDDNLKVKLAGIIRKEGGYENLEQYEAGQPMKTRTDIESIIKRKTREDQ